MKYNIKHGMSNWQSYIISHQSITRLALRGSTQGRIYRMKLEKLALVSRGEYK